MSPNDLDLSRSLPVHRKRSSQDTSDPPDFEPEKSPTKKVRFILDDDPTVTASSTCSPASANKRGRANPDEMEPSFGAPSLPEVLSQIPDLRLPQELGKMEHPLGRLPSLDEQADPRSVPPPSPRLKPLELPESIERPNIPWAPTIPALTSRGNSEISLPGSPYNNRPQLDEDLLVSQIEEFAGIETDGENPNLAQARKNVEAANAAYQLADCAMGVAREKKISVKGDAHMANIVRRAVARLRAAREKEKEIVTGGSGLPDLANEQANSNDERDEKGNVWCLGMLGDSLRNHCCSDCENLAMPRTNFHGS